MKQAVKEDLMLVALGALIGVLGNIMANYLDRAASLGFQEFSNLPSVYHAYGIIGLLGFSYLIYNMIKIVKK